MSLKKKLLCTVCVILAIFLSECVIHVYYSLYVRLIGDGVNIKENVSNVKKIRVNVCDSKRKHIVITDKEEIGRIVTILKTKTHRRMIKFLPEYTLTLEGETDTVRYMFLVNSLKGDSGNYVCDYDLKELIYGKRLVRPKDDD